MVERNVITQQQQQHTSLYNKLTEARNMHSLVSTLLYTLQAIAVIIICLQLPSNVLLVESLFYYLLLILIICLVLVEYE